MKITDEMVNRFLSWPLPDSVCSDLCATKPGYPFPRAGTNLLSAPEARAMLEHVLADVPNAWECEHGCGIDRPHTHTVEEVAALRSARPPKGGETP